MLQVCNHLSHTLIPPVSALLRTFHDNIFDAHRNLWHKVPQIRHRVLNMLDRDCHGGIPIKRNTSCQHLKHGDTHRINIALLIRKSTSGLLRRSIVDRTHYIRSDRVAGRCFGNAKIRHLHLTLFGYHDVLRLDIPMYNVVIVRRLNAHGNLYCNTDGFLGRQPYFLFDIFFECDALHQLHHDIMNAIFLPDIVYIHDIGMHESRGSLCLHAEF